MRAKVESADIEPLLRTTAAVSNIPGATRETVSRMRSTGKPKQRRARAAR
jgi:hypothetical protein